MTRRRAFQLVSFLLAVGLFAWLLMRVGLESIGQALTRVGWHGALVVGLLGLLESASDGVALATAIGGRRSLSVVAFNSVGGVVNQLLPFDLGEVAKVALMHRYYPDRSALSGTIVWNYVFKLSRPLVALVAAVIGVVGYQSAPLEFRQIVLLGAVLGFVPYGVFRLVLRKGGAVLVVRFMNWARKAPLVARLPIPPSDRLLAAAAAVDESARSFWIKRPSAFLVILATQTIARCASWASLIAAWHFVGGQVTLAQGALLYAALNIAEFVITALPARLGVAEFAAFGVFKVCGLDPGLGVAMYLVLRIKSLITNGALAPMAFLAAGSPPPATETLASDPAERSAPPAA